MYKVFASSAKRILGSKTYNALRARYKFRSLESPFPMYPDTPFQMDWDNFRSMNKTSLNSNRGTSVKRNPTAYIVSPTQRSGTNYLSTILSKHPQLAFPKGDNLPDEQCLFTYSEDLKSYCYKTVSTWSKWINAGEPQLQQYVHQMMAGLGGGILDFFSTFVESNKTILFKTPDTGRLDNFYHLFPESKVIILIRDGRDTVESFARSWGGGSTFSKMCERWSKRVDTIFNFISKARNSNCAENIILVRYEDININTRAEVERILEFLELKTSEYRWEELDDIPVLGSSSYKGNHDEVHWEPLKKSESFQPVKKWTRWSSKKKSTFKRLAGENLIKLGYAENNSW